MTLLTIVFLTGCGKTSSGLLSPIFTSNSECADYSILENNLFIDLENSKDNFISKIDYLNEIHLNYLFKCQGKNIDSKISYEGLIDLKYQYLISKNNVNYNFKKYPGEVGFENLSLNELIFLDKFFKKNLFLKYKQDNSLK